MQSSNLQSSRGPLEKGKVIADSYWSLEGERPLSKNIDRNGCLPFPFWIRIGALEEGIMSIYGFCGRGGCTSHYILYFMAYHRKYQCLLVNLFPLFICSYITKYYHNTTGPICWQDNCASHSFFTWAGTFYVTSFSLTSYTWIMQ